MPRAGGGVGGAAGEGAPLECSKHRPRFYSKRGGIATLARDPSVTSRATLAPHLHIVQLPACRLCRRHRACLAAATPRGYLGFGHRLTNKLLSVKGSAARKKGPRSYKLHIPIFEGRPHTGQMRGHPHLLRICHSCMSSAVRWSNCRLRLLLNAGHIAVRASGRSFRARVSH